MTARSERDKMLAGDLYVADSPELADDTRRIGAWMRRYNAATTSAPEERRAMLAQVFAHVGAGVNVRPPFFCDYGYNITMEDNVFLNFNCVILDGAKVTIGRGTQIGPAVQILAADHPRDPLLRAKMLEFSRPVTIGSHVWIGGGAIILPGVTIGDDVIVGAGSVVTRDAAPGSTVVGNPARPLVKR